MPRKRLTKMEEAFITSQCHTVPGTQIAIKLGVSKGVVQRFLKNKGLTMPKETRYALQAKKSTGRTNFTSDEDVRIRREYLTMPIKALAELMGRSYTGIMGRIKSLGLNLPTEIIERNRRSAQIKKGNIPANKGRKQTEYMTEEQIARTAGTRFKKGHLPHNAKDQDGIISVRRDHPERGGGKRYKYIRLSLGRWRPYHTYLWELANGPIPKGHCLWFKDGDTMNCSLDNLELITRKENMSRNSVSNLTDNAVANYIATDSKKVNKQLKDEILKHPELIQAKRTQLLINRKIRNHGKKQDHRSE